MLSIVALGGSAVFCGCSAVSRTAARGVSIEDPFAAANLGPSASMPIDAYAVRPPAGTARIVAAPPNAERPAQRMAEYRNPPASTSSAAGVRRTGEIQLTNHEWAGQETIPARAANVLPAGQPAPGVQFTPADPRVEIHDDGVERFPDEYLLDGGDRGLPVHYDTFNRLGLDTEDTVAEYVDHTGRRHMKPSTRVAVYAPRFASVRARGPMREHVAYDRLAFASDRIEVVDARNRISPTGHIQPVGGAGIIVRSRASQFDADLARGQADQVLQAGVQDKLINIHQNVLFLRTGRIDVAESAWLATRIEAAFVWSGDQHPVITAKLDSAHEIQANALEHELVGSEDDRKTPGLLRIVKLADRRVADRGDVVTFTIRYDNLGDHPVHHVRIVDNLTPRLEYVDDSADSDRAGRLVVQDNEEGSLVLIFEVDDPVPGRSGGVVTFRARVK